MIKSNFDILERCINLTLGIVEISKRLKKAHQYVLADQVMRSAGSIGANVAEAQAARSSAEFESINNIALREARETIYWLTVISRINVIDSQKIIRLKKENQEISNIVAAIILSSKRNRKNKKLR
ncbi:four helix bundle protein [Patescibacteria group bacterium]